MLAEIKSSAVAGIDAYVVDVEVDISFGLPVFNIVGLPETAVRESRDRVKTAIKNSGYSFPLDRITVNLAPADIKKQGTGFDLPVAMGILAASKIIPSEALLHYSFIGELSLDGSVKPVNGILPAALAARKNRFKGIVVPFKNRIEASIVNGIDVLPIETLSDIVNFFSGFKRIEPFKRDLSNFLNQSMAYDNLDFSEVAGQNSAKRALEIAAAGGHNVCMTGPPGSGKSMLAKRLPSILPELTFNEAMETTGVYSVAGLLKGKMPLVTARPFRSPHHTISGPGLIGGGKNPEPGEASLAHNGILFLDELPEFRRNVLEVLRQPMEDGNVTISRVGSSIKFPASFMLIAAMNPCPCGYYGDSIHECRCSDSQIQRYRSKISGPLLDRIDIHIEVPAVPYKELAGTKKQESSSKIRKRVKEARKIQTRRFKNMKIVCNAGMESRHIKKFCTLDSDAVSLLKRAVDTLGLSARAYSRVIKIARTIADLEKTGRITKNHIAEAIQYRTLDRKNLI